MSSPIEHWDAQGCELLSARGFFPGTTQGSGVPACTRGTDADLPGRWYNVCTIHCVQYKDVLYRCAPTYGDLLCLGESVSMPETRPASPANWCAMSDDSLSTDHMQGGHSWPLPNRWGMHPLLTLHGDKELPETGPDTRTKVSTFLRHMHRLMTLKARREPLGLEPPL